jgi:hypothetical protein
MLNNRYLRSTLRRSHWRFYLHDLCGCIWLQNDEWLPIAPGLLNCMRARSWMERLMQAMENVNGYTVSGLMRDRIAHASETRWLRMEPMPETYRAHVQTFTGILGELDAQVLRHHPEGRSFVLMDREERRRWDEARAALMALLLDRPNPFTEEELSTLTECPRALIPWERLWHDD